MKHLLIVTTITAALLAIVTAQEPSPSATPDGGGPRCTLDSASVEVHTFYGTKATLVEKVAKMPTDLSERRVFLQVTQIGRTEGVTTVKLFERQKDESLTVTQWKKAKVPELFDKLDEAIIKNKGEHCVGEAMKDVVTKKLGKGSPLTPLAPPSKPKDAFGPSLQDGAAKDFFKTIIIFGC